MDKYIKYYDNALDPLICRNLIDYFNVIPDNIYIRRDNEYQKFDEIVMADHSSLVELEQQICSNTIQYIEKYKKDCGVSFFPKKYGFERVRIKRYNERDRFNWHADVGDYASARRFLVCMYHLNDDFMGGATQFGSDDKINYTLYPKQGRISLFTPFWNNPHRGQTVLKGSKYILNVYTHYL